MIKIEVRGGDGGADAANFAKQLTDAVSRHAASEGHRVRHVDATSLTVEADAHYL